MGKRLGAGGISSHEREVLLKRLAATTHVSLAHVKLLLRRCRLCNRQPIAGVGVFIPIPGLVWSTHPARRGSRYSYPYGLCQRCTHSADSATVFARVDASFVPLLMKEAAT